MTTKTLIDTSELDRLGQLVEHLEGRDPASITDDGMGQLEHVQAATRRAVEDPGLDDGTRLKAVLLYGRATEVKVRVILAAVRAYVPRLCRSCGQGHRVRCTTCTRSDTTGPVTVRVPGHVGRAS